MTENVVRARVTAKFADEFNDFCKTFNTNKSDFIRESVKMRMEAFEVGRQLASGETTHAKEFMKKMEAGK